MTYIETIQNEAAQRTDRLRNPSNAVPDYGIDLTRKSIPKTIPVVCMDSKQQTVVVTQRNRRRLAANVIKRRYPYFGDIMEIASLHFAVAVHDIEGHSQSVKVTLPRQVCCYLARLLTPLTSSEIGRCLGDRDHSTILHAARKIESLVVTDAKMGAAVETIKHEIHKRFVLQNNIYCFDEREL